MCAKAATTATRKMIRPLVAETLRYGHYSVAGEFVYDHPFQWGSKRTGPDLHRVGGKYSDEWQRLHMIAPRDLVPESIMPAYPWLEKAPADHESIQAHMTALRRVGVPYTDAQIAAAPNEVKGKTELDALVAYLQGLGLALKEGGDKMNFSIDINSLRSVVTAFSFALFIGILVWAYRPARKTGFDEAAQLPFAADKEPKS